MAEGPAKNGCGITVFAHDTPKGIKTRKLIFFAIFCLIILLQTFYYVFANSAEPFVLEMPFGMFIITMLIAIEFFAFLVLYLIEASEMEE
jgi:hypothetical protein